MTRPAKRHVIHVNMHIARANAKSGATEPCITVRAYDSVTYAHEAIITDDAGVEVGRVVYRPDTPLEGGGTIWIEAYGRVDAMQEKVEQPIAALTGTPEAPVRMRVSKPTIRANISADEHAPVLTLTAADEPVAAHSAVLYGANGQPCAEVVYRPADPLSCGARLWVQTRLPVTPLLRDLAPLG